MGGRVPPPPSLAFTVQRLQVQLTFTKYKNVGMARAMELELLCRWPSRYEWWFFLFFFFLTDDVICCMLLRLFCSCHVTVLAWRERLGESRAGGRGKGNVEVFGHVFHKTTELSCRVCVRCRIFTHILILSYSFVVSLTIIAFVCVSAIYMSWDVLQRLQGNTSAIFILYQCLMFTLK